MRRRGDFRHLRPAVFSGLLDDPLVLLRLQPTGRSLLLDCGAAQHLAKRVVKEIDAVFVSHAHMDHFMGFDTLVRHLHASPRTVDLFGPPGIAARVAAKFSGYDWNLAEPYWATFRVHEILEERLATTVFPGPGRFVGRSAGETPAAGGRIYGNDFVAVTAALCDHDIPSAIFRIDEAPSFGIDPERLEANGLVAGEWLRLLKKRFYQRQLAGPITVMRRDLDGGVVETEADGAALYPVIAADAPGGSVGYVTDVGFSSASEERIVSLLAGVTLLVCECTFLSADRGKARLSRHLCTDDLSLLANRIRPRFLLPLHVSKSCLGRSEMIYSELEIPPETTLLRLPEHLVPAPLTIPDVPFLVTPS